MGTHPIFESDFDCLTEVIYKWVGLGPLKEVANQRKVKSRKKIKNEMNLLMKSPLKGEKIEEREKKDLKRYFSVSSAEEIKEIEEEKVEKRKEKEALQNIFF